MEDQEVVIESENKGYNGQNVNLMLLATFVKKGSIRNTVYDIFNNFSVINEKVFLLRDTTKPHQYVLTYNVDKDKINKFSDIVENTVSLHRKKDTNTLYTLNALNELVKIQNNGNLDNKFMVDWSNYRNCIVLTKHNSENVSEIKKIDTRLVKIIHKRSDLEDQYDEEKVG